jgi:hypothetical protein
METLYREKRIRSIVLGKRTLFDIRDLDAYVDELKGATPQEPQHT